MAYINANTFPGWRERTFLSLGRLGTLDQVMATIQNVEKVNPSFNNPGALIYAGQPGASSSPQCFPDTITHKTDCLAQFDSLDSGTQAWQNQIQLDASRGLTIAQFTAKYAPASDPRNDPTAYAQYIANSTGLDPSAPLSDAIAAPASASSPASYPFVGPMPPPDLSSPAGAPVDVADYAPGCDPNDPSCGSGGLGGGGTNWGMIAAVAATVVLGLALSSR